MRLPNAEKAIIERRKLTEYLLSETHPTGRFKARFFKKLGFEQADVEKFEEWLRSIALNESVTEVVSSPYGVIWRKIHCGRSDHYSKRRAGESSDSLDS